jgi:hypothetical protein
MLMSRRILFYKMKLLFWRLKLVTTLKNRNERKWWKCTQLMKGTRLQLINSVSIFSVAQLLNKAPSIQTKQQGSLMNFNSQQNQQLSIHVFKQKHSGHASLIMHVPAEPILIKSWCVGNSNLRQRPRASQCRGSPRLHPSLILPVFWVWTVIFNPFTTSGRVLW